jgi:uracil-DNA glycosylase
MTSVDVDPSSLPGLALREAGSGRVSLEEVRALAAGCRACDLWARGTQTVFGEGRIRPSLMLVGEQPGDQEDRQGHPFVGPAGRILAQGLQRAGIDRERTFVTNAVKHFRWRAVPGSKRRLHERPDGTQVTACRPWLEAEIELVHPAGLVLLGATAAGALLGPDVRVTRDHGRPLPSPLADVVVVTIHPSAVLRSRGDGRARAMDGFVADLEVARDLVDRRNKAGASV